LAVEKLDSPHRFVHSLGPRQVLALQRVDLRLRLRLGDRFRRDDEPADLAAAAAVGGEVMEAKHEEAVKGP